MAWDAALADVKALQFQEELQAFVETYKHHGAMDGCEVLHNLQALWKKYYRTTGHKRLARVLLKEIFE